MNFFDTMGEKRANDPVAPGQDTGNAEALGASITTPALMRRVLYALIPGAAIQVAAQGTGFLLHVTIAAVSAAAFEAIVLIARGRKVSAALRDGSAVLTGFLLALGVPATAPWWITIVGTACAIILAKQLFGGLGRNVFNPAMVGYAVMLLGFPGPMTAYVQGLGLSAWDAATAATPLSHNALGRVGLFDVPALGLTAAGYLVGGLWLCRAKLIDPRIPYGLLGALSVAALGGWVLGSAQRADPLFHLFAGATFLGAFFIATDPVSAPTTSRGRTLYGGLIGIITYVIREFGGYPDGMAFAVLLGNCVAPTLDRCCAKISRMPPHP